MEENIKNIRKILEQIQQHDNEIDYEVALLIHEWWIATHPSDELTDVDIEQVYDLVVEHGEVFEDSLIDDVVDLEAETSNRYDEEDEENYSQLLEDYAILDEEAKVYGKIVAITENEGEAHVSNSIFASDEHDFVGIRVLIDNTTEELKRFLVSYQDGDTEDENILKVYEVNMWDDIDEIILLPQEYFEDAEMGGEIALYELKEMSNGVKFREKVDIVDVIGYTFVEPEVVEEILNGVSDLLEELDDEDDEDWEEDDELASLIKKHLN